MSETAIRKESPGQVAQRQIGEALGLLPGLRAEKSRDGQWRCSGCNAMQPGKSWQVWVPDSVSKSDPPESVIETCRRNAFNGHGSAWCLDCARAISGTARPGFLRRLLLGAASEDIGLIEANRIDEARPKWPDTDPVDKSDPHWEFNNNANINGVSYFKKEVEPGRWQWVVNEEAERRSAEYEGRKWSLFDALSTRVLTDDELKEAAGYGSSLNIRPMVPYSEGEKSRELSRAFSVQRMLRQSAGAIDGPTIDGSAIEVGEPMAIADRSAGTGAPVPTRGLSG